MTLTIFSPVGAGPIGPGVRAWAQWIPDAAPPAGSQWHVYTTSFLGPPEQIDLRHVFQPATVEIGPPYFLLGDPLAGQMTFPRDAVRAVNGDPSDFVMSLRTSGGAVIEEARIQGVWDASWDFRLFQTTAPAGGFTTDDRLNLNDVLSSVRTVLPASLPGGIGLVMSAIDLVRGPPRSLLQPFGSLLLSGRGTFSAQPPGALHSFGGTWSWFTVPTGYGKDDGALVEWHRRLAQFVVIREGAGDNTYIDVLEDSHYEGNFILWQFPNPTEIQYDVAPGVQVLWRWLV